MRQTYVILVSNIYQTMETEPNKFVLSTSQQLASSCIGALLTSVIVTPLDVVKIRLQAQQKTFAAKKCFVYCNGLWDHVCFCGPELSPNMHCPWYKRPGHFHGTGDALLKIIKYEGIASLWSGLPPTLIMAVPATMLYFTAYDKIRDKSTTILQYDHPPVWLPTLCGAFARVITVSAVSPLEFIRTKVQSEKIEYSAVSSAMKLLIKKQGIFSIWRGWVPHIWRDVPFSAAYWTLYETFKKWYHHSQPTLSFNLIAGATSGTVAAILTLPFDVIKTHRQIEMGEAYLAQGIKRISTIKLMSDLYKNRGIKSLYAGLVPRILKVAPACAIMISTYEYGKQFFMERNQKKATQCVSRDKF